MVRWVSARSIIAVLGLGGLALAQEGVIVDPWRHPSAAPFGESAKKAPAGERAALLDPWPDDARAARGELLAPWPSEGSKASPRVVPVGPPIDLRNNTGAVTPVGPAGRDELLDPWPKAAPQESQGDHRSRLALARHDWAWEVQEIIDPWAKGPVATTRDPLIIDPWSR